MRINRSSNAVQMNIADPLRESPTSAGRNTDRNATQSSFSDSTFINDILRTRFAGADDSVTIRREVNQLLQQYSEWLRVSTESKRLELFYSALSQENNETSDIFGKIMDIARRIMNGENVSNEEMRFLTDQNPQLVYVLVVLREEAKEVYSSDRRRDRERRQNDRRSGGCRRDRKARKDSQSHSHILPLSLDNKMRSMFVQNRIK